MERFSRIGSVFDQLGTHARETADTIAYHAYTLSHPKLTPPDVRGIEHAIHRKAIDLIEARDFDRTHPYLKKKFDIGPLCDNYLKGSGDMDIASVVRALQNGFSLGEIEYNLSLSQRFITKVEEFRQISPDVASTHVYDVMLQRTPLPGERQGSRTFGGTTAELITSIRSSDEFGMKLIKATYTHVLARNVTDEEVEGYEKQLSQGFPLPDLLRNIRTSREARSLADQTDQRFTYFVSPLLEQKAPVAKRQATPKSANRLPFTGINWKSD